MPHAQQDMIQLPEQDKKISQEYFDSIVNKNINDLEMSPEKAVEDAIQQCKSQGCDISDLNGYGIDVLLKIGFNNQNSLSDETIGNLMFTLSKLAVRNEFCQEIYDKGGLKFSLNCIEEKHLHNTPLVKSSLSLIKSVCNNDQVKMEATRSNAIPLLKTVLDKYSTNVYICELICKSLSTLLLRNKEATDQLFAIEFHRNLVQLLSTHAKNLKIIKPLCLALRNSISRSKEYIPKLIELKIEDALKIIWNDESMKSTHDEVKAVLRDCGLNCDFNCPWVGTGAHLEN